MLRKAYLEITNVCNLRCAFCPGTKRTPRFLTAEEFALLAGKLRGHTEYLYFHLMGEPLLCLLYTSPSPRDKRQSRMPSSA